ncbi:unnamed protein product [Gordionus sp. m RMFG-2023]
MKVKLAVQVFSSSVAKGILLAQELKIDGFENCESTVDFIQMIDQMFDFLNTQNIVAKGWKVISSEPNSWVDCRKLLSFISN